MNETGASEGGERVTVSLFDVSVDNHFKELDTISKLCGKNHDTPLCSDDDEVQRLSSRITFLREWKQFQYKPKKVMFASGSPACRGVAPEVVLPQFSSASVPKVVDEVSGSSSSISKDYVLYVGGSVWALDWCPRQLSEPESTFTCEFVAIATHPPGSYYHKIGVPLCGRGMIQIWCLLNAKAPASVLKKKHRAQSLKKSTEPNESAKRIGRPRKKINECLDIVVKRSRGRPRKIPTDSSAESCSLEQSLGVHCREGLFHRLRTDECSIESHDCIDDINNKTIDSLLLLEYSNKDIRVSKRKRGRPRKDSIPEYSVKASVVSSAHPMGRYPDDCSQGANIDSPLFNEAFQSLELENFCTNSLEIVREGSYQRKENDEYSDSRAVKGPRGRPRKTPAVGPVTNFSNSSLTVASKQLSRNTDISLTVGLQTRNSYRTADQSECNCSPTLINQNRENKMIACSTSNVSECSSCCIQIGSDVFQGLVPERTGNDSILTDTSHAHDETRCDAALNLSVPDVILPKMVFCLAHNGKVVWDMKWKKKRLSDPSHHMGYLAVLLGNGTLEVWDVPLPSQVKKYFYSNCEEGLDPRFVKLKPVFRCSHLKCSDAQSIPLTIEWSHQDDILVGCHDGTVALWKFSPSTACDDERPVLCFSADTEPIRAVAWSPVDSDHENANIFLTAGHVGLKFWDIRDPYRPLWDLHPVPRYIYSIDWLPDPKCIMLSFDDGTMRLLSLVKSAYDAPVHGHCTVGPKQYGLHVFSCSSFAIWSVQVSRLTGMVAYCTADGSVNRFQLTHKAVEKDPGRHRTPHYVCGCISEDASSSIVVNTPSALPCFSPKPVNKTEPLPGAARGKTSARKAKGPSDDRQLIACRNESTSELKLDDSVDGALIPVDEETEGLVMKVDGPMPSMPSKMVAMHRVRWNMNRGSERWLCSGGAAGIVRCQEIVLSESDVRLASKGWLTKELKS